MRSYILHGDNTVLSRKRLSDIITDFKKDGWEIVRVDWSASKKQELLTLAQSQNLLSSGTLVIVENFFSGNKKANEILKSLKIDEYTAFIFWDGKQLGATATKGLKDFIIQEFKIPTVVFNFLNSIAPGNARVMLKFLEESLQRDPADFLLVMIARHVRNLIWVKVEPESMTMPDWQKRNLSGQASKFSKEQLYSLHHKLLELDRGAKTSQLPENLRSSLEVLIAQL
jgi:hypothetical protein